jgi:hypothetical protein
LKKPPNPNLKSTISRFNSHISQIELKSSNPKSNCGTYLGFRSPVMDYAGVVATRAPSGTDVCQLATTVRCVAWWSVGLVPTRVLRTDCCSVMKTLLKAVASLMNVPPHCLLLIAHRDTHTPNGAALTVTKRPTSMRACAPMWRAAAPPSLPCSQPRWRPAPESPPPSLGHGTRVVTLLCVRQKNWGQ